MKEPHTFSAQVVGENDAMGVGIFEFDASVVTLLGEELNIWVGEEHFILDPEGSIQRGQFIYVKEPASGSIARIVEANSPSAPDAERPVKLEHEFRWDSNGLDIDTVVEYWSREEVEAGGPTRLTDEDTAVMYIRPTSR